MALESATYIDGLVTSNPTGSDNISQGDEHIRLIKTVLKNTMPNAGSAMESLVKLTRLQNDSSVSIQSTSMTDAATFSITKVSATSNLLIQANLFGGLWAYATTQTGEAQVYNDTDTAVIGGNWKAGGQWNSNAWTSATNNEVRAWTTMTVLEDTPLSAGVKSIKIRGNCTDPGTGGYSTSQSTLTVWEIEQ